MDMEFKDAKSFFSEFCLGEHHIPGKIRAYGPAWYINFHHDLSTFDFDYLTRLVFLAHDRCVRASIQQSGPRMIKIIIWAREGRDGSMYERHPTIEHALSEWREAHTGP